MPKKLDYKFIIKEINKKGYTVVDKEIESIGSHTKLTLKDVEGYYYISSYNRLNNYNSIKKCSCSNPYTIDNLKLLIRKNGIEYKIIGDIFEGSGVISVMDKDGYCYKVYWQKIFKGDMHKFSTGNPYTVQNIKLWCKLNNKPFELISEEYEGNKKKLKWKCLKDGCEEVFEAIWNNVLSGAGCGYCFGKQIGLSNCLATNNPELAKEWHPIKNGNLTPYDVFSNSNKHYWWKCRECGHEWITTPNARTSVRTGCPKCNESKGEKRIGKFLKQNNIYAEPQMTFEGLVGLKNGDLSYDFYLPKYNLLIEYQGEFHDGNGNYFMKQNLYRQQEHDKRKKEYTEKNNIKLLEIWYWDYERIEEILNKELDVEDMVCSKYKSVSN